MEDKMGFCCRRSKANGIFRGERGKSGEEKGALRLKRGAKKLRFFRFNIKQKAKKKKREKWERREKRDGEAANHESFIDIHISM